WISPYNYMKLINISQLKPWQKISVPLVEGPHQPIHPNWMPGPPPMISIIGVANSEKEIEVKSLARLKAFTQVAGAKKTSMNAGRVAHLLPRHESPSGAHG